MPDNIGKSPKVDEISLFLWVRDLQWMLANRYSDILICYKENDKEKCNDLINDCIEVLCEDGNISDIDRIFIEAAAKDFDIINEVSFYKQLLDKLNEKVNSKIIH